MNTFTKEIPGAAGRREQVASEMSSWLECTMTLTTAGTSFRKMFKPLAIQFQTRSEKKTMWEQSLKVFKKVYRPPLTMGTEKVHYWGAQGRHQKEKTF